MKINEQINKNKIKTILTIEILKPNFIYNVGAVFKQ